MLVDLDDSATVGEPFRRDPDGSGLNSFLNYGYAILSSSFAREIVAAGLQRILGLHHHGRSNLFCLADDLIEPFRSMVHDRVRDTFQSSYEELNQPAKAELLDLLTCPMRLEGSNGPQTGPLTVMLHRTISSLVRCYAGEARRLAIPTPDETAPCEVLDTE